MQGSTNICMDPDWMRIGWGLSKKKKGGVGQHRHLHGPYVAVDEDCEWGLVCGGELNILM